MDKVGPNHIGMMVVNLMGGHGDQIMPMKFWPLIEAHFDNALLCFMFKEFLCVNPSSRAKNNSLMG